MIKSFQRLEQNIKRLVILFVMGVIIITSTVSVAAFSQKVYINDREKTISVYTVATETNKILKQAGINLEPEDSVKREESGDGTVINVLRAFPVNVVDSDTTHTVSVSTGTVDSVIKRLGINVGKDDIIVPSPDTEIYSNMQITISRKCTVTLTMGNDTKEVVVPKVTVRKALKSLDIELSDEDTLNVSPDAIVEDGMNIDLVKVEYKEHVITESIPFSKLIVMTDTLEKGETSVEAGVDGTREVTMQEKIVNGEVIEIKRLSEKMTVAPKNEITYMGVKANSSSSSSSNGISQGHATDNNNGTFVDHTGQVISYKSKLTGSGTAYTSDPGAITSTGKVAQMGYVAVDPKIIPYGTKLYITTSDGSVVYGYAVAADTGGAMLSGKRLVDLYYNTVSECYQFGVRDVTIYIL